MSDPTWLKKHKKVTLGAATKEQLLQELVFRMYDEVIEQSDSESPSEPHNLVAWAVGHIDNIDTLVELRDDLLKFNTVPAARAHYF